MAAVLLALVLAVAQPSPAQASTVSIEAGQLVWAAPNGETNNVLFRILSPGQFTIVDTGFALTAGAGCTQVSSSTATCPTSGVTSLVAHGRDGNDGIDAFSIPIPVVVEAGLGNDQVQGGEGNDSLTDSVDIEDTWGDVLRGGNDTMYGNGGDDLLDGATGNDTLNGGAGNDRLLGGYSCLNGNPDRHCESGDDRLNGDGGNDLLDADAGTGWPHFPLNGGHDELFGGSGTDTASYGALTRAVSGDVRVTLDNVANDGRQNSSGNSDNVRDDIENVAAGDGNDVLIGSVGIVNVLSGGGGNDALDGGAYACVRNCQFSAAEPDTLDGGDGSDGASYGTHVAPVNVNLANSVGGMAGEGDTLVSIESAYGGPLGDSLTGSAGPNGLAGGAGDDVLIGLEGNDGLDGEAGTDVLHGDSGNDGLVGGAGDDWLDGGVGADGMTGGADADVASYSTRTSAVVVTLDELANDGGLNELDNVRNDVETVNGGAGNDTMTGDAGNTTFNGNAGIDGLTGGDGADTLNGGPGADALAGEGGSDQLAGGPNADSLSGGAGSDIVTYADHGTTGVSVTVDDAPNDGSPGENDNVASDNEQVDGSGGPDVISGDGGANSLQGMAGNDTISGGAGEDWLDGGAGEDALDGGAAFDGFSGGNGSDTVRSRDGGPDSVGCGDQTDSLFADAGDAINADCEAVFFPYVLSVSRAGSGSVTSAPAGIDCGSDCSETLESGSNVVLTAAPASNFIFTGWSGACSGTGTCALTMDAAKAVTATFSPGRALAVSKAGSGSGTVTGTGIDCGADCSESYVEGTVVTLTAAAATGSTFAGWSGGCTNATGTCTVTMNAASAVTASFSADPGQPPPPPPLVDRVAPDTRIKSGPPRTTRSRVAKLALTSTEAGSTFQCKLDKAAWRACTTPKTYRKLKKGRHTFLARAIDAAGNVDATPAKRSWRIR